MKTIGIIGGGQLGMMLAVELKKLNQRVICLDPNPNCPASKICDETIVGAYQDFTALQLLGKKSDVLTYEFENVPALALKKLQNQFYIPQGIQILFDSQNRIREKENALKYGLNPPKFRRVTSELELKQGILELHYPCIYKTTTLGYDGHGQVVLHSDQDLEKVKPYLEGEGILEEWIDFDYETSLILVKSKKDSITFPMTINKHKRGILDIVVAGKKVPLEQEIVQRSKAFMEANSYEGILTIEFFIKNEQFYFNEMAPRAHNSGHYTIEGCSTNQFQQWAYYLLEMSLEQPHLLYPSIMKNILGYDYEAMVNIKSTDHIFVHNYGKNQVLPYRKMGHITFTNCEEEEYIKKYAQLFKEDLR